MCYDGREVVQVDVGYAVVSMNKADGVMSKNIAKILKGKVSYLKGRACDLERWI